MSLQYDPWLAQKLKELIDLILQDKTSDMKVNIINNISEIEKGLNYGKQTPGTMDTTLIAIAEGMLGPIKAIYSHDIKEKSSFDVSELQNALEDRRKDKVLKKMSGSLDLLKDFD